MTGVLQELPEWNMVVSTTGTLWQETFKANYALRASKMYVRVIQNL